jgi:aspartate aminotransferase
VSFVPSANLAQLKPSATIAVAAKARALKAAGRRIIDLGAGEPDFITPAFIREAAKAALDAGATKYTNTEGILPLREAIAAHANAERAPHLAVVDPSEIVVSNGSKQSLYNACVALFGPGDEVLIPVPSWTSYFEMVGLARATVVPVDCDPANGFKVTADDLRRHATPRTKGVMLNSPTNPTGAVYSADELRDLFALAAERGWWMLTDEIYRRIVYGAPAAGGLQVAPDRERIVVIDGVAKAYAMTGWRIGWTITSAPLAKAMGAFQSHTTSNPATVSQYAALAALTRTAEADAEIAAMVAQFKARRDAAMAILAEAPSLTVIPPDGAFYLYVRAPGADRDPSVGARYTDRLLEGYDLAAVPGEAFGTPGWVRVSYAASMDEVVAGARALVAAAREFGA